MIDRQDWLDLTQRLLAEGRNPSQLNLDEAAGILGVTKGSLYQHFKGKTHELYEVTIAQWSARRHRDLERDAQQARQVRDPLDRLKIWRGGAALNELSDMGMRNWEHTATAYRDGTTGRFGADAAGAALEKARNLVQPHVAAALADLGLAADQVDVETRVLIREFGLGPGHPSIPFGDDKAFNTHLEVISRSVRDDLLTAAEVEIEDEEGGAVMVIAVQPRAGQPVDRRELADRARAFLRAHLASPARAQHDTAS